METNSLPMNTTDRLIGQQKSGQSATFAYDNNSNLTTKWHQGGNPQTMQYDAADRLTTMQVGGTTTTFQWGLRGVMARQYQTGSPVATYSYTDINNNLRVAQDAAGLTTSTYDGDNLRRKIVAGSVTTTFVWDGSDYLQIKPSTGDPTLLVLLEGEVVGHVKGSEKRDYIVDPLGSVVAYLNSSQTLTDQFEYWPYGEMVAEIETGTEPFLWVGSLGYFRDSDLRTYIRAREYRQDLGSWMQLDPLWPNSVSFQYSALPLLVVDPSGLEPCVCCFLAAQSEADVARDYWLRGVGWPLPPTVESDAIGHCNSRCEAARRCGRSCAEQMAGTWTLSGKVFGGITQDFPGSFGFQPPWRQIEEERDRHNDSVGISIAGSMLPPRTCLGECVDAFYRGRLRVRGYSWVFPPVFPYTPRPSIIDLPRPNAGVLYDWPEPRPRSSHVKSR